MSLSDNFHFDPFQENSAENIVRKMVKKGKATTFEKSEMVSLFSDTTCSKDEGNSTWEAMYNLLEEEQPRSLVKKATKDAQDSFDASYFETSCSFLHRITARPKIIPYIDMVKWAIDEVDISGKTFKNHR